MKQQVRSLRVLRTGRWSALIECPDGMTRRFISRGAPMVTPSVVVSEPGEPVRTMPKSRTNRRSPALRFEVLARDKFTCRYCGRAAPDVVLHVDHVVPFAAGGLDEPANLVTACQDCNQGKGSRHSGAVVDDRPDLYVTQAERNRAAVNLLADLASPMATPPTDERPNGHD